MPKPIRRRRANLPPIQSDLLESPEVFFGLVAPIGTDLVAISKALESALSAVGYRTIKIKVSSTLKIFLLPSELREHPLEERYKSYMDAGNYIRRQLELPDALARLAVFMMRRERLSLGHGVRAPSKKTAYIFDQLKRPEEIAFLRQIYGGLFFQISAFSSEQSRIEHLTTGIADSHHGELSREACRSISQDLISRDSDEEQNLFGQRVKEAFHQADVIVNANSRDQIHSTVSRFVELIFGHPFLSPDRDEFCMSVAKLSALRSTDLSRQVGAAIANSRGEILTTGFNEVPAPGGGAYTSDGPHDARDHKENGDPNVQYKNRILADLLRRLKPWLGEAVVSKSVDELIKLSLSAQDEVDLKNSQLMDVLEYGRIVHAEMMAISDAARLGIATTNAILYCTTFPCHICARHIIAAGIKRVVYIEPYPKSAVPILYPDSVVVEGRRQRDSASVFFDNFMGVAPRRFMEIFARGKRKDDSGAPYDWNTMEKKLIVKERSPGYLIQEAWAVNELDEIMKGRDIKRKEENAIEN